jgi:hypothetical protein
MYLLKSLLKDIDRIADSVEQRVVVFAGSFDRASIIDSLSTNVQSHRAYNPQQKSESPAGILTRTIVKKGTGSESTSE